jgi:hypothetical protein
MTTSGFWIIYWKNVNKIYLSSSALISFIAAFSLFDLSKSYAIQLGWILLFTFIFIISILSFYSVSTKLYSQSEDIIFAQIIKVLNLEDAAKDPRTKAVYLIRPSKLFREGCFVSVYYNYHEDLENLIGIGLVTAESEKVTQIELSYITNKHSDIIKKMLVNDKDILDRIKVKPLIIEKEFNELITKGVPESV